MRIVVSLVDAAVTQADGVGITFIADGAPMTAAASNDWVRVVDDIQYAAGDGPCLSAITRERGFRGVEGDHEATWDQFFTGARAEGLRGAMSAPLRFEGNVVGALNIYSRGETPFNDRDEGVVEHFSRDI